MGGKQRLDHILTIGGRQRLGGHLQIEIIGTRDSQISLDVGRHAKASSMTIGVGSPPDASYAISGVIS